MTYTKIDTALLFAAGRGKRMGSLTDHTPKPLLQMGGRALIDYAHDLTLDAGLRDVHVNASYLAPQIESHFAGRDVHVHHEADGPYETGGTLKALAPQFPPAIVTVNSDVLFFGENPISQLIQAWDDKYDALLLLVPSERALGHQGAGDFFWDASRLTRRNIAPSAPYIYASAQIIKPARALEFDEKIFSVNLIWNKLIDEERIGAVVYQGRWMDLGNAQSLKRAEEELVG